MLSSASKPTEVQGNPDEVHLARASALPVFNGGGASTTLVQVDKSNRQLLAVMFFISGFSGLAYQVVWTRMAFANYGIITPVLSVVLSVYMLGLAIGSWAGGRLIGWLTRSSGRAALVFYAGAEAIVGVGAFAAPQLLKAGKHVLLGTGQMDSTTYLLLSALAMTAAILPWCVGMGATFPFMMAHVRETSDREPESFSFLYAPNVLGAMCGCLITAVVLVERLGFAHTLWVAAAGNFLIAVVSIVVSSAPQERIAEEPAQAAAAAATRESLAEEGRVKGANWILFTTGFAAMALEVVWTRSFAPILRTQVYSFAFIVFTYLLATFVGSTIYRRRLKEKKGDMTAALLAALVLASVLPIALNDPRLESLATATQKVDLKAAAMLLASICPFCGILGYLTPSLIDRQGRGNPRRAGSAYGLNILGCILGPLAASYVLLPQCSERVTSLVLAAPLLLLYLWNWNGLTPVWRAASGLAAAAALIWSAFLARDFEGFIASLRCGMEVRRDFTASVIACGRDRSKNLLVNGIGMTALTPITKFMVHLPLALHKGPSESVLIICFGMGTSYRSALSWGVDTTAVELAPSVPKEFDYFHKDAAEVLRNPKGRIVVDDGRRFLERTDAKYDLIVIDPPPPVEAAGSSLLYSKELYVAAKRHLKEHGILATWFPSGDELTAEAIFRSVRESFPYVRCFPGVSGWGIHYFASSEPIAMPEVDQIAARFSPAARTDLLEWSELGLAKYLALVTTHEIATPELAQTDPEIVITDDHPFNEYFLLRSWGWQTYAGQAGR